MELDKDFSGMLSTAHHPSTIPFFKKSGVERHLKITLQRTLNCRDPTEAQCTHSVCSVARRPHHDSVLHCAESLWGTAEVPNLAVVTAYGASQLNCTGLVCALCLGYADKNSSKNCLCACACVPFQISRVPDAAPSLWGWFDLCFEYQKTLLPLPVYFPKKWTLRLQLQNIHVPHIYVLPSGKSIFNWADVATSVCGEPEERQLIFRQLVLSAWCRLPEYTTECMKEAGGMSGSSKSWPCDWNTAFF